MTSAQVVETSVTDNSSFQNYIHPDDHSIQDFIVLCSKFNYLNQKLIFSGRKNRGSDGGPREGPDGNQKRSKRGFSRGSRSRGLRFVLTRKMSSSYRVCYLMKLKPQNER